MSKNYKKRSSLSLVIREQNKTKILYHFNPNKIGKIKNMRDTTCQSGSDVILLSTMLVRI